MAFGVVLGAGAVFFLPDLGLRLLMKSVCSSSSLVEVKRPLLARGLTRLCSLGTVAGMVIVEAGVAGGDVGVGVGVLDLKIVKGVLAMWMI